MLIVFFCFRSCFLNAFTIWNNPLFRRFRKNFFRLKNRFTMRFPAVFAEYGQNFFLQIRLTNTALYAIMLSQAKRQAVTTVNRRTTSGDPAQKGLHYVQTDYRLRLRDQSAAAN